MPLFVTTPPSVHGVFAVEKPAPAVVTATGSNVAVIVGQFPWGPSEKLNYPASPAEFNATYAPAGMNRTGSAFLSVIRKGFPILGAVRVEGSAATQASASIQTSGLTVVLNAIARYPGSAGNSLILTISAADDANSNHFNFAAQVSSASGTTTEIYRNCNVSGVGANVLPNLANSVLLASVTSSANGIPAAGNTTMSSGTDGTINSQLYVGTPGGGDAGFALLEADNTINHVFTDDPGNSLRPNVNGGLFAHVELTTDRMGYINGNSAQAASDAQSDVSNYRSIRMVYVDPWAFVEDDVDGTVRLAPSSCWAASVCAQVSPSVSPAWKADFVSGMMAGISGLEVDRGANRGQNTAAGIMTLIKRATGGYAFEAGKNTSLTSGQTNIARTRMGQYMARSVVASWQPYVDGPNVPFFQQDLINSLDTFLGTLKKNQEVNPAFLPYIVDYGILPTSASNTNATIAAGDFTVAGQAQIGSAMERIYFALQYGEGLTVNVA